MFDNIFGGSDDEDDDKNDVQRNGADSEWDIEVSGHTGFRSSSSNDSSTSSGWFRTHTISLDLDASEGTASTDTQSPSQPAVPDEPTTGPSPGSGSYDRGTFVFPDDRDFMQKVEARGLNGAHNRVETVYVLAGNSYTTPTDLFRLDNPSYYKSATRRSVVSYGRKMANKVAALYPDGKAPKLLVRFHTHPGGSTRPSDADRQSAAQVRDNFADAFGTSDFEFFQGIHAYKDHGSNPSPSERHSPTARSNSVSWRGEQYRHELALFGPKFQNPRKAVVTDD
ncbi:hypothetical protein D3D02_13460 [Halobellus sp. Atlit-38R]|uniref:Mov34/MPN/PAD-1 family protein n=1 Tax=Halobellus sp. Atlit-38R TaxID=2282131 RepID=UPI000EF25BCB|nr:Mov34/MPN/PAD-1 family protein [Halobellus sp. Atlit-38R]RLM87942.1 hypothetical protein D3D02_13460 [Halobellus sp. Atlit-38R]